MIKLGDVAYGSFLLPLFGVYNYIFSTTYTKFSQYVREQEAKVSTSEWINKLETYNLFIYYYN